MRIIPFSDSYQKQAEEFPEKLDDLAKVLGVCKDSKYRSLVEPTTGARGIGTYRFLPP